MTTRLFRLKGSDASEPAAARIEVEELTYARRVRRALGGAAAMVGAAIVCIAIPMAHFVLVPLCLLGAVVFGIRRMAQKSLVVSAKGKCPDCGAEQDLDLLGPWTGRTDLSCRNCHRGLTLIEG